MKRIERVRLFLVPEFSFSHNPVPVISVPKMQLHMPFKVVNYSITSVKSKNLITVKGSFSFPHKNFFQISMEISL